MMEFMDKSVDSASDLSSIADMMHTVGLKHAHLRSTGFRREFFEVTINHYEVSSHECQRRVQVYSHPEDDGIHGQVRRQRQ